MLRTSTHRIALSALASLALLAPASANETGLGGAPHLQFTAPGADFYQVSATTRGFTGQTSPFTGTLPAPPPGAIVVEAIACWNYLLDGPAPAFDVIQLNGQPVLGDLVAEGAPDLDWSKDRGATYLARHIGQHMVFGGANTIADACDKALGSDPAAFGAGMTILVAYTVPGETSRTVSVWVGYSSTESSPSGDARAELDLPHPYLGGEAHFFLNALDGELFRQEELYVNGALAGGLLAGTGGPSNPWGGLEGPAPHSNLYDALDDDVSAFMAAGDVQLRARTVEVGVLLPEDQMGHTFAALSIVESCGDWSTYCTPKVNSLGCTPVVDAVGTPSAGASGAPFQVRVDNLLNSAAGSLFYGYASQSNPFQGGTICVAPPVRRTALQSSGGTPGPSSDCTGQMSFDFNAYAASGLDASLVPGVTVYAQWWTRDPFDPFGTNLSGGIAFDLCP